MEPQNTRLLKHLVENRGQLAPREGLVEAILAGRMVSG